MLEVRAHNSNYANQLTVSKVPELMEPKISSPLTQKSGLLTQFIQFRSPCRINASGWMIRLAISIFLELQVHRIQERVKIGRGSQNLSSYLEAQLLKRIKPLYLSFFLFRLV